MTQRIYEAVVADTGTYFIICDISEYLEEKYGIEPWDCDDLPRHDPRIIEAVRSYLVKNPKQDKYKIVQLKSNKYKIISYEMHEELVEPDTIQWEVIT